ncbi:hypothetical protein [Aliikangiella coralliicola]|nr:hypothetical protein [Aliikangiella coralliicola]
MVGSFKPSLEKLELEGLSKIEAKEFQKSYEVPKREKPLQMNLENEFSNELFGFYNLSSLEIGASFYKTGRKHY